LSCKLRDCVVKILLRKSLKWHSSKAIKLIEKSCVHFCRAILIKFWEEGSQILGFFGEGMETPGIFLDSYFRIMEAPDTFK
jgi:hypothetical protein